MEETLIQSEERKAKKPKSLREIVLGVGNGFKRFGRTIANNWDWYDMNQKCVWGGILLATTIGYSLAFEIFVSKPLRTRKNLTNAKQEVLFRYGDSNNDGYVSQAEKDSLFAEILKGKGVRCLSGERPIYEGGQVVSREDLTDWINTYMNSKQKK